MKNITVCCDILALSLVVATLGLELDAAVAHDAGRQHVAIELLFSAEQENIFSFCAAKFSKFSSFMLFQMRGKPEAEDIEGVLSVFKFFIVVD